VKKKPISEFELRIPASTSNIGPGFDCLGLAFNLYNRVRLKRKKDKSSSLEFRFSGPYASQISQTENNLFLKTFDALCHSLDKPKPSLFIDYEVNIPVFRGLGSSANAVLAAYFTASTLFDLEENNQQILSRLLPFEGHPDNLTPSLTGGLTISTVDNSKVYFNKYDIKNDWRYLLLIPDFHVSTDAARKVLPELYKRPEIIYSLSRLPLLIHSFLTGNAAHLPIFLRDKIHHPYRTRLIPFYEEVENLAYARGAAGVALSGSGSSIIIIIPADNKETATGPFLDILHQHGIGGEIYKPHIDNHGTIVTLHD